MGEQQRVRKARLIPVKDSSCISYVGFDTARQMIIVQFKKGGHWYGYPANYRKYLQMISSPSIGKWVNDYLVQMPGQKAYRLTPFGREEV